jgi:hypothetical protein
VLHQEGHKFKTAMRGLFVFDLDDTLLCNGRVPRQTFHALRNLKAAGHAVVVISCNALARVMVALRGLGGYVDRVLQPTVRDEYRADLMAAALAFAGSDFAHGPVYYFDDRQDNLDAVCAVHPFVHAIHVPDPYQLYASVRAAAATLRAAVIPVAS